MTTTKYMVTGMTCNHCVNHIKEEVGEIAGVEQVEVSLEDGQMVVTSQAPIDLANIEAAVEEAGEYQVKLA